MKTRVYFLVLLIFVFGIFAGCSKDNNESKKTVSTNLRTESSIPEPERSTPKTEVSSTGDTKTQKISFEENTQKIKNSSENKDFSGNGEYDISLNGETYKLNVIRENLEDSDERNKPTRITMKIRDSKIVFEDLWNDGITVKVADLDNTDGNIDIYVTSSGTDIECQTTIYKFDGDKMFEYDRFYHNLSNFLYDGRGNIYCSDSGVGIEVNRYYNYKSKKTEDIVDNNQKTELTLLWKQKF